MKQRLQNPPNGRGSLSRIVSSPSQQRFVGRVAATFALYQLSHLIFLYRTENHEVLEGHQEQAHQQQGH
jgi:hypothetical protein